MPTTTFDDMILIRGMVAEAHDEDRRSGSRFDRDGWGNYFLETWKINPEAVRLAWTLYDSTHQ